jgi:hypothetical protein
MLRTDVDAEWLYQKMKYYVKAKDPEMAKKFLEAYRAKIKNLDIPTALKILENKGEIKDARKKVKKNYKKTKGDE